MTIYLLPYERNYVAKSLWLLPFSSDMRASAHVVARTRESVRE